MRKTLAILLCVGAVFMALSCQRVDKFIVWQGDKEVSAEGGIVEWTPLQKGPTPIIKNVILQYYDSEWKQVNLEEIKDPGQKVTGQWYEIIAKENCLTIKFSPNNTEYHKEVDVTFDDGVPGGNAAIIIQKSKLL